MEAKEKFMKEAIDLARKSAMRGDYALGCVIVKGDEIISVGTTNLKHENDPTVHGEIVAIRNACNKLEAHYLQDCILYTTHEPCPMCASAAIWAKMKGIVFGNFKDDAKKYATENFSWRQIDISCKDVLSKGEPTLELVEGFMHDECLELYKLSQ